MPHCSQEEAFGTCPHTPEGLSKTKDVLMAQQLRGYKKANGIPLTDRKNDNPEARVNAAVKEWLTLHRVFFFRVNTMGTPLPGGGYRPASTRGISDFIAIIKGQFVGLESKSDVGRQSDDQRDFEDAVKAAGGHYYVIRSVDDLERYVKPLIPKL